MVAKTDASTDSALESKITCVKYTLFCFNVTTWIMGGALFGLSLWLRVEPGLQDWFDKLTLQDVYKGLYILIAVSIAVMIVSFVGCCSVLMEQTLPLLAFIALQAVSFVLSLAGSAVFLDLSTYNSSLQPLIRRSVGNLIANSQYEAQSAVLRMIQENIGCCGADGAQDYVVMRKPLPTECRDTVTGNAFYYGCVDEITWFLEDRSSWVAGIAMTLCMINVINAVLTIIFLQALRKEEEEVKQ
ncbi:tetraspanin-2A [Bacillus rossius redtenbacheri]|uniref:tetraspanin-2A n=1 Tax=Bacillus rossius redtenbacheri TaxID=93214 RepID=UPI002FDE0970